MRSFKYFLPTLFLICHFISIANEEIDVDYREDKNFTALLGNKQQNNNTYTEAEMQEELLTALRSTDIPIRKRIHILPVLTQFKNIEISIQKTLMDMFFEVPSSKGKKTILKFFGKIQITDVTVIQQLAKIADNQNNPLALRILAIQSLSKSQTTDEKTQLILVRLSIYSRYKALRRTAKSILKQIPVSQQATQLLAAIANSDTSTTPQRIIAVWNLKYTGQDHIAGPLLGEIASNKKNPEDARIAAIQAMKSINNHEAAQYLVNIYNNTNSNSSLIRKAAYEVLEEEFHLYIPRRCPNGFLLTPL